MVAATIYAGMRGKASSSILNSLYSEFGDGKYSDNISTLTNASRSDFGSSKLFTDFREFLPTAPGPYAPGYTSRPSHIVSDTKTSDSNCTGNLDVDLQLHNTIVSRYNLGDATYNQATVQAIADKESESGHLFGGSRTITGSPSYSFEPVFGMSSIGVEITPYD
jgi:hypothetical protein